MAKIPGRLSGYGDIDWDSDLPSTMPKCYYCGLRYALRDLPYCVNCAAAVHGKRAEAARVSGMCMQCGEVETGASKRHCDACRAAIARRSLLLYQHRKQMGMCVRCGKVPPVPGITHCEACREVRKQIDKRRRT